MEKNKKNQKIEIYSRSMLFTIIAIILLFILMLSLSFGVFVYSKKGTVTNTIITGTLMMTYTEGGTGIRIMNAMPMSDAVGKKLSGTNETFKFSVSATMSGRRDIRYEIAAIKKDTSTINDEHVRLYLEKAINNTNYKEVLSPSAFQPIKKYSNLLSPVGSMILDTGIFERTQTNNYILRMWLAEDAPITGEVQNYTVSINVYGALKK